MSLNAENYYQVLEIKPNSNEKEIQESYLKLKTKYKMLCVGNYSFRFSEEDWESDLEKIEHAYIVLSCPRKRQEYNRQKGIQNSELEIAKLSSGYMDALPQHQLLYEFNEQMEEEIRLCRFYTGKFLREIREYKGLCLKEMEKRSKVAQKHLENIEGDHFEKLPAQIYVRGFLIHYARVLELDEQAVVDSYLQNMNELSS